MDIFRVHLAKRGRDPHIFDLEELAQAADGFSGSEVEAAVKGALVDAFTDGGRGLATVDVLRRVRAIPPTSEVKREEIEELRRWAREHLAIAPVRGQPAGSGERLSSSGVHQLLVPARPVDVFVRLLADAEAARLVIVSEGRAVALVSGETVLHTGLIEETVADIEWKRENVLELADH